mmetsp:Transcript_21499/g.43546  ORF Transcript_21499/g.43546 Transcript_21499/m.43546 type:complete len:251 (-) Transcript_21499:376-1128(-)
MRPAHAVEDGQPHVRPAELRDHGRVRRLHRRVDDRLRMDDNFDVVVLAAEEVVRFNHLQTLVHHRCRVDSNLRAHVPVGMCASLLAHHLGLLAVERDQLVGREVAKGAARGSKDDATQRARRHSLQTLEDGRVLRIRRCHLGAILVEQRQDHGPACDQRLLVRQRNCAAQLNGFDGRKQACAAHHPSDHRVSARRDGNGGLPFRAHNNLRKFGHAGGAQSVAQFLLLVGSSKADHLRPELGHLRGEELDI